MSNEGKNVNVIKRYSSSLKRKIVEEVESGAISVSDAMDFYGIKHRRTVTRWLQILGTKSRPTEIVRVMMSSEKERIKDLEKLVAQLELKNLISDKMLELADKEYPDFKKNLSTKRLKKYEALEKKREQYQSELSAKR